MQFNKAQLHYLLNQTNRDIFLKARQLGFTTLSVIDMLDDAIFIPNTSCGLIAHTREDVQKIFRIAKLAYDNFPENIKPVAKYDNKNELYFAAQNSIFFVALQIRGGTVNKLHISEAAHIKNFDKVYVASAESVPQNGVIRVETTGNGLGGPFFNMWTDATNGDNDYKPHFYGWNWDAEYVRDPEGMVLTKEDEELQEKFSLTNEQMAWMIWKRNELKRLFSQEYPLTPEEAFIASGGNRFNIEKLKQLSENVSKPIKQTEFVTYWKLPEEGRTYVMGSDCSKGSQTGDWGVTEVLDFETAEQVAELRGRMPIERFTKLSMELGKEFFNALWGIELQDHGFTAINIAKKEYKNLYVRTNPNSKNLDGSPAKEYGWSTNAKTKPIMIDELDDSLERDFTKPNSKVFISECMTYLEDVDATTNAAEGCHDDTVIGYAIALQMRKHFRKAFAFMRV